MSQFWSLWITVLTIITLILLSWVLFATRRMTSCNDDNTTGHNFDGIIEEDNPLPQWWLIMFVITIIFGVGYLIVFPGLGNYQGILNWSSASQHKVEAKQVAKRFAQRASELSALSFDELVQNEKAIKAGRRLYANNCSVCHGANAGGAIGFPNLSDTSWQWGGTQEQVIHSITYGRKAAMPPWEAVLSEVQIGILVDYLLIETQGEFADKVHDNQVSSHQETELSVSSQGRQLYTTYCIACHGATMTGTPALGAPSLVDEEWLYGASRDAVTRSIKVGRNGVMPAQKDVLGKEKIELIAAYLLSLSRDRNETPKEAP